MSYDHHDTRVKNNCAGMFSADCSSAPRPTSGWNMMFEQWNIARFPSVSRKSDTIQHGLSILLQNRHVDSNVMHCFRTDWPNKVDRWWKIYIPPQRVAGFLSVWQIAPEDALVCLRSKNKVSASCLFPSQQTNKADVILGFLKAWSERAGVSKTRRRKIHTAYH